MSICYPRKLLCPEVPRSLSSSVVGLGRRPRRVAEGPGPSRIMEGSGRSHCSSSGSREFNNSPRGLPRRQNSQRCRKVRRSHRRCRSRDCGKRIRTARVYMGKACVGEKSLEPVLFDWRPAAAGCCTMHKDGAALAGISDGCRSTFETDCGGSLPPAVLIKCVSLDS